MENILVPRETYPEIPNDTLKKEPAGQSPPLQDPRNFNQELVAGRSGLHIAPGINGRVVHPDFVVHVRTR